MARIIRRVVGNKKRGAALIAALQVIALILIGFFSFIGGPQQSPKAPAETQVTGPAQDQTQTAEDQTQTAQAQPLTAADKASLRKSAHLATELYEPLATQVFNLATSRAAEVQNSQNSQNSELPNEAPTLTTDREDYPPFSYVYFHGTGFQPGETVNMIVVDLSPADPAAFKPWDVVADENGEFDTSWYIFSSNFNGATLQATATGQSSRLTALANASASVAATAKGADAAGPTSVTSNTVTASSGQILLILVTAESDSTGAARPITSVANTSGANPLQAPATLITTNNASNIYMYAFRGTATGTAGTVTATFTGVVNNAAIHVIRLSDNNTATPIGVTGINSKTSPADSSPVWVLSGALTPGSSMLLFGALTNGTNTPPTWSTAFPTGFTQLDTFLVTEGKATRGHRSADYFGPSAALVTGSISGNAPWGTIAIEILPASTPTPTSTDTPTATTTAAPTATPTAIPTATPTGSPETNRKAPETPESNSIAFASGSLIIPMDTDTTGNHTNFNQNSGMWKAYGLLYKLLKSGVPVRWAIKENKVYNDIDFTVSSVTDKRTNTNLSSWSYRGGPFIIDSADAAAATPIITAWWAANSNLPNVHVAQAAFNADVNIVLRSAPRIANEAINAGISLAYYNAAGIPDSTGIAWTTSSVDVLDETEIAGGGLFMQGSVCLQRKYDIWVTPHNTGYASSLTDPTDLGTRTYAQLDTFVHQGGGWTALCHSLSSNDTWIANLTKNGSASVKALFKTSQPGGIPGGFLTTNGFPFGGAGDPYNTGTGAPNLGGTWTVNSPAATGLPPAQFVPTTGATQVLPGGSVQTWPLTGQFAPVYYGQTERIAFFAPSYTVKTKVHSGTTATLTFTANHTIPVGATVTVALNPADSRFDGTFTVTAVTASSISYLNAAATVGSTNSGGTVTDVTTADVNDHIIAGTYHNGTGLGKLTYIGGHTFAVTTPYSTNAEAPYLKAFYNSLFFNGNAVAKLDLMYSPTTFPQNATTPLSVSITNTGASTATNATNVIIAMSPGFTYIQTTSGPPPDSIVGNVNTGQTLTWNNLGNIPGGTSPVTIQVLVDSSVSHTVGFKSFGTFHATYGDIFGEAFTADICRDIEIIGAPPGMSIDKVQTSGPNPATAAGQVLGYTISLNATPPQTVGNVTSKSATTTTATITVAGHSAAVGNTILVALSPADARFDGQRIVTAVTTNTISYSSSGATVNATATGGTVTYPLIALTGITVTDVLPNGSPGTVTYVSGDTNNDGKLQNTETWVYTASYTVSQADIDAGQPLINTATGDSNETDPVSDTAITGTAAAGPSLSIEKTANPTTYALVGEVITYSYRVTNNGNVTITAPFTVFDDKTTDESCPGTPTSLAPTQFITCTSHYTITQADIVAGSVVNTAYATGMFDGNTVTSNTDTATVTSTCSPPTITCPAGTSVQCFSAVPSPSPFTGSTSNGCGTVTVTSSDSATNGTSSCNNVITRTYTATDSNGSTATCTQTITVNDTTAPTIGGQGDNGTVECPAMPVFSPPTASDTCGGATVVDDGATTTAGTCGNTYSSTKSWHAIDACGNTSGTVEQTIHVIDTTAPDIGGQGGEGTVECPAMPVFSPPTASDTCGGATVVDDGATTTAGTCGNTYSSTKSWHAIDACGNTSGTVEQTIHVIDTTAPDIGGQGGEGTVECPAMPVFSPPTASDTCGGATVVDDGATTTAGTCGNTYSSTKSWHAIDACGNTSGTVEQTIHVIDTTAPDIGGQGGEGTVECPAMPVFSPPTASDTCGGATVVDDGATTTAGTCGNTYSSTKSWHAIDACGNTSGTVEQTIHVIDTTAPDIGGQGGEGTVECPAMPVFSPPTASDTCGGATVVDDGATTTAGTCGNTYSSTKSWHAIDACGNTSGTVEQTIHVIDTTAPDIGGQGGEGTVECPAMPVFSPPTASDTCGGATVVDDGATTTAGTCGNTYSSTKSWHAIDACGNTSGTVEQTIHVIDTTAPDIGGQGAEGTVECPAMPVFSPPTASDTCGGATVVDDGATTTAGTCGNTYSSTKSWHAIDACGNTSGTVEQTIHVIDTTAPDIGGQGGEGTVECPAMPVFSPPTASDTCSGATVVDDGATTTAGTCGNTYSSTKSWHAIDACGNTSGTVEQTIHVIDTTAPDIGGQGGEGTVECPAMPVFSPPTASDTCGGATVVDDGATTTAGTCGNTYSSTKSWHAIDACGNTSGTVSQTIHVIDTTAPDIGGQGGEGTVECPAMPVFSPPTASDTCGGATVVDDGATTTAGTCGNTYSSTKSWHAIDACGNTSGTVSQTIHVVDTTAPDIGGQGGEGTVECPAMPVFSPPTASDTCGGATVVDDGATTTAGTCGNTYSSTKSWHAIDACGNTSGTVSQTIHVIDTTAPDIGGQGGEGTVECPAMPVFSPPTASDTCGGATVVDDGATTTAGTCGNTYSSTKSWHAIDACGNTSGTVEQTIHVIDTTAPDIGGQGGEGTVECPAMPVFSPPTASDTCGGATVVDDGATTTAGTCGNTYSSTKSWHAIDACGNTSGTVSQTIHVVDTTAPDIGGQGGEGTVECPAMPVFSPPTASDTCGGATVVDDGATTTAGTCGNTYSSTKSWHAIDACGNTSGTVEQTIHVIDTTAPDIGGQGAEGTVECPATPVFSPPTASDTCGGATVVDDGATTTAGTCGNTYSSTKSWHAIDACGNTSGTVEQTIHVIDTTAPDIGGQGGEGTVECPAMPVFSPPTASDTCGGATVVDDGATTTAGTCGYTYSSTKSWHAIDACGNTSGTVSQTIHVIDTTAPDIGGQGGEGTVECPAMPVFSPPTASDTCGGATVVDDGATTTAGTCGNTYSSTKSWHAIDACGNTSGTVEQTIHVIDTTAPDIGGQGGEGTVECPAMPVFSPPTASDTCGGATVVDDGATTTAGTCGNTYSSTKSWHAIDACGNTSGTVSQTIHVIDTTAPDIGGQGAEGTVECPAMPVFSPPTASDTCGGATVVDDGATTTAGTCGNTYSSTKSWHAIDACGNTSGTVEQTIHVIDTTAPDIGGQGGEGTVECPAMPVFSPPTASDTCSGATVVDDGATTTAGTCGNTYSSTKSWHAIDACGNTSGTVEQTIHVIDTTAPDIGGQGGEGTVECPAMPVFSPPTASDTCGGATVVDDGATTTAGTCGNTYSSTKSWHAIDACGNTSGTVSQTIHVVDTTAPDIGGQGGEGTVECPAMPVFSPPTASDTCGGATVVDDGATTTAGTCGNTYSSTKSWHAIDACGNTSGTVEQTIHVIDTTAPDIGGQGAEGTVECPATPVFSPPTASDTCGGATVVDDGATTTAGTCGNTYSSTKSWHAIDACGNTSGTVEQTIHVIDTTAPDIGGQGGEGTVECPAMPVFSPPTASDTCGGATVVDDGATTTAGTCGYTYSSTKSWHAIDACGNTSGTVSQTIHVIDTTAPDIGGQGGEGTVECPAMPVFSPPTASDTCGGATVVDDGATTTAGTCGNTYSSTKSWHAIDACGNTSGTVEQTIHVIDTTAPDIGGQGGEGTVECPAMPVFSPPTASDTCGGATVVDDGATTTAGTCGNTYSSTKSWHAIDACGNTSGTVSQTIHVIDTTAPDIGGQGAEGTVECPAMPVFSPPTASDTCGGATVVDDGATTTAGTCGNTYSSTKSWHAIDACGNTSGTVEQTIHVIDTTAPDIGGQGGEGTVECPAMPVFSPPTASDTCSGATVVDDGATTTAGTCGNTYSSTKSWHAIDACGNTSGTVEQTIHVIDTTAPDIGGQGGEGTVECPAMPVFSPPTASDTCGGATVVDDGATTTAGTCGNTYSSTKSWHAIDACGNTSGTVSQTIHVVDTTAPDIGGQGGEGTVECPAMPVFSPPTASDTCGGATVVDDGATTTAGTCGNTYSSTKSWHAIDACGNTSGTVEQTIHVIDTTAPDIGGQGSNATIECPATPSFTAPTASDACGGSTVQDLGATTTAGTCANNYTSAKSWKAVDACGNTTGTVTQTITVRDTTAPTIGGQGSNATIECPASPSFTAPTASDACGGATVVQDSDTTAAGSCANNYSETVTWHAVDACGNTSAQKSRTVTVVDTTAPVLADPAANATIQCPATPSFTAPTASDACGGATVVQDSDTTAAGSCANNYSETRTWHAVDACGNTSAQKSRTVTVVDTTAPTIVAGADTTIACNGTPMFVPPTASDACGTATVNQVSDSTTTQGTNTIYTQCWRAADACGNTSGTVCQTITRPACQTTPTPTPTSTPCALGSCTPPYPFPSGSPRTNIAFNESEVLRAFRMTGVDVNCTPNTLQLFYNDEHALTLGVRQVIVKTSSGTTTTPYTVSPMLVHPADGKIAPMTGATEAQGGVDVSGRPMFPAMFITDVTANPGNPLAGDWQYGGTGRPPDAVFGTWKAAVRTVDQTVIPNVVTVTPDADPAANNWNLDGSTDAVPTPTPTNQGYGAECRWDMTNPALGLIPGHQYRIYFMVHDGDQNKAGGDAGQACVYFTMPGTAPTPTPTPSATASPTPTATSSPTPTPAVIVTNKTFSGKTVVITFQNNTASGQLLDSLAITWPQATNGNLNQIKMGGTVIYNTPTGGGTLSTSSLLGTTAQRTIAAGSSQTLTFTFKNNVNTTASNYTGSVHFSPFGTVTWLP